MSPVTDALYHHDGDRFVPTVLTTGPWDPAAQHGGAPAALLAGAIESVDAPGPMQVARITFELLRPVPLTPLQVTTEVLRPGRKVQLVQASLRTDDGTEVMRATALRIRVAALDLPAGVDHEDPAPIGPEHGRILEFPGESTEQPAYHSHANEIRFVEGGFDRPGPATGWIHLRVPVVAGEPTTPTMRACGAADFGNGFSWALPRGEWLFINPDLTVHLARPPAGEWIALASTTSFGPEGAAMAESALYDATGRIGRAAQSLILDRR